MYAVVASRGSHCRRHANNVAAVILAALSLSVVQVSALEGEDSYVMVSATPQGYNPRLRQALAASSTYLISSFPDLRQVAYTRLPDNVWRPLVIGNVSSPQGVAVDPANSRLFVADPPQGMIYWFPLIKRSDGLLETGNRYVAVEGYNARWLAVNSIGDLYFTGEEIVPPPQSVYGSIYRQDAVKIAMGDPTLPTELYTRSNSGNPNPAVWMPGGIAVDSFNIYWGNRESGTTYGSLLRGNRQNVGLINAEAGILHLSSQADDVRGIAITGTEAFFLSTSGVYGVSKMQSTEVTDANVGLVSAGPSRDGVATWDPQSIAYDGDGSLYMSDKSAGAVWTVPALSASIQPVAKFVDAPGIHGLCILESHSNSFGAAGSLRPRLWQILTAALALTAAAASC